ncbi:MAG: MFS transporter [Actinomycetia bacterium]|nr:MFS transporter [Actinomycetes bacterium]
MLQSSPTPLAAADAPSRRPLDLLLLAALCAAIGNGISVVAFPWLVLENRGSVVDASIVAAAASLAPLISTLIAGAAVDSLGRRRISVLSDVLSGATVTAVPLIALVFGAEAFSVAVLAILAALGAAFDPAGITARNSMLPEAADCAGWTLDRANGLYAAMIRVGYILGPGLAGLLITTVGVIDTMWVTAGTFAISIAAVTILRVDGAGPPLPRDRPEQVWAGIVEGLKFVWDLPVLRTLVLVKLAIAGLFLPMQGVLFPKYFVDRNAPAQLGWVLMALSTGAVLGALAYPLLLRHITRRIMLAIGTVTLGICTATIAFLPAFSMILLSTALIGLACGPIEPIFNYTMQTKAPQRLRGRVIGTMTSLAYSAGPLGFMLAGPLADAFGLQATFLLLAIPMTLIGPILLSLPSLHELDRSTTPQAACSGVPQP